MKRILLSLGLFAIALTSISATQKTFKGCTQTIYLVDRYACGDVLLDVIYVEQPTGCGDPQVNINQSYSMPIPCTHLHPPGGRY